MASNFLIDTSKKALLFNDYPKGKLVDEKKRLTLTEMSLRGDLDTKVLQKIGFTYKEEFEEGSKVLDDAFNKYSTQAKALIDKILTDSIAGKLTSSINQAENSDLKAKLTTLMTMAMTAMPSKSEKDVTAMLDAFNLALRYRIPYRKKIPAMNATGNTFTLKFAYGKCNLFNAKEEVWLPIAQIKNILCPKVEVSPDNPGLLNIVSSRGGVPYTQQSLVHVLKATGKNIVKAGDATDAAPLDPKNLPEYMKQLQKASKALVDASAETEAISAADRYITDLKKAINTDDGDQFDAAWRKLSDLVPDVNTKKSSLSALRDEYGIKKGQLIGMSQEAKKSFAEHFFNSWETSWKKEYENNNNITLKKLDDGGTSFKTELSSEGGDVEKEGNALINILKNIVNYQINVEGYAANDVYNSLLNSGSLFYLYYGYPQSYLHSQGDILKYFEDNTGAAKIRLGPFIPEEVEFLYDMEHTDGDGYPMAGEIIFKSLFSVAPYGEGLALDSEEKIPGENGKPATFNTPGLLGLS